MVKGNSPDIVQPKNRQSPVLMAIVIFIFTGAGNVYSQYELFNDTISINPVTVTALTSLRNTPFSVRSVDSSVITFFHADDIGYLLQSASPFPVRRYGNTGMASLFVRGMSGSHTLVTWNGISVTPPNSSTPDIAMIPVQAVSSVTITGGGADLHDITGAIGGKIDLVSLPGWNGGTTTSLTLGAGSYDEYTSSLIIRTGNEIVSSDTRIWGTKTVNNYRFINKDSPEGPAELRRENAASSSVGLTQDIFIRIRNSILSGHLWYNEMDRELPGPVTTVQQNYGETQDDRSVRTALRYKAATGACSFEITGGFTSDINLYNNEAFSYGGDNRTKTATLKTRMTWSVMDHLNISFSVGDEYQSAISQEFEQTVHRNLMSAGIGAAFSPLSGMRLIIQLRETMASDSLMMPEITAGVNYNVTGSGCHIIKANVSRNMKIPSLNDMYWVPGGVPGLKPEVSRGGEIGYSFVPHDNSLMPGTFDINAYVSSVRDMIQWVPSEHAWWTASNVSTVRVMGIEAAAKKSVGFSDGKITAGTNYSLTSSVVTSSEVPDDPSTGKQMTYVPMHHFNANISAEWRFIRCGAFFFTDSKRYTLPDNSAWLPVSYQLDVSLGAVVAIGSMTLNASLSADNILNTSWESISTYPMPLRTFLLRMSFTYTSRRINTGF